MSLLVYTSLAERDLEEIHDYIARDSVANALIFLERLDHRCRRLAEMPRVGRKRPELAVNVRSVSEGRYVIFYRPRDEGITVLRVLHGARDLENMALEDE